MQRPLFPLLSAFSLAIFSICISECISSHPIVLKDTHSVQGIKYPLELCAHTLHAEIHSAHLLRPPSRRSQHSKQCFLALRVLQWLLHSHIIVRLKMESFFFFLKIKIDAAEPEISPYFIPSCLLLSQNQLPIIQLDCRQFIRRITCVLASCP